jgi:prephenate dehydrogenase
VRVHIIGTGLLGASLGLALSAKGHQVTLEDTSPTAQQLAADLGAGQVGSPDHPDIVVVATPPDVAARVIASALEDYPNATVTDVASVKTRLLEVGAGAGHGTLSSIAISDAIRWPDARSPGRSPPSRTCSRPGPG